MAQTITSLLSESASASASGDTRRSWKLINDYAQHFWLVDEADIPTKQRGDFYAVRAAAADWMGLEDEAISALRNLLHWAREGNDNEAGLIAGSHLAYQSLNQSEHSVYPLPSAASLLADLAERMRLWRPDADSLTLSENPEMSWKNVSKRQAGMLTASATTAHTVATNLKAARERGDVGALAGVPSSDYFLGSAGEQADGDSPESSVPEISEDKLAHFFASVVRRFGRNPAQRADELLWFAQEHWAEGRLDEARASAEAVLELPHQPVSHFEAHYMLGHFAMLDNLNAPQDLGEIDASSDGFDDLTLSVTADNDRRIANHWGQCANIAIEIEAPVMAMERAELACRTMSTLGREGDAWELASRMVKATDGIPVCPAMLDMRAMLAQAAFMSGLHHEAWENSRAVAEWSEFSPNLDRTIACYTIATFAGLELGLEEEVRKIQSRRAELYRQAGQNINASQVLQSIAMSGDVDYPDALTMMNEARELLREDPAGDATLALPESDARWNLGEWHLTMAHIVVSEDDVVEQSRLAAENFHLAADPIKECMAWLTMAGAQLTSGLTMDADASITKATAALPDLQQWMDDTDADFDPVIQELIEHYRYILDFRKED